MNIETAKLYHLPLTRDYCRNWTSVEAVREILQNAIDYGHGKLNYTADDPTGKIEIISDDAFLEPRTLLLGATSKAEDRDSIGSFGEGYKIALLVLAREGIEVKVFNGPFIWTPMFVKSKEFGEEVLAIAEEEIGYDRRGVSFTISGLSREEMETIRNNTLHMQSDIGTFHRVEQGDILMDRPGKLYVNGLFICETGLVHGYNVKPAYIQLERDRQTVSSWDLQWLTKDMWFRTGLHAHVAEMLDQGIKDVEYAQYGTPELVKEACYRRFREKHPGAVVASSQEELDKLVAAGLRDVIVVNNSYGSVIKSHANYNTGTVAMAALSPKGELEKFYKEWNRSMSNSAKTAFESLIKRAAKWK